MRNVMAYVLGGVCHADREHNLPDSLSSDNTFCSNPGGTYVNGDLVY